MTTRNRAARRAVLLVGLVTIPVCAAANAHGQSDPHDGASAAVADPQDARAVEIIRIPEPLPLPAQLKPRPVPERIDPKARIDAANAAARQQPASEGFFNAMQRYPWAEGALYQLYASPGQVTDIVLQEGEQLVGPGPIAAGDTTRWIIGDTLSGSGPTQRVHILVKPTRSGLVTNLVINTDRRTYHLELRSTPDAYMASVSWAYPQDALMLLTAHNRAVSAVERGVPGIDLDALNFAYRVDGDRVPWRPVRTFDDGRQVFIELPPGIAQSELPPLFVTGAKGEGEGELVNYRVRGKYLVVDRLFSGAELRLGAGKSARRVRVLRETPLSGEPRK
ncbi:P-type conjugative transfer protein TrbG [Sphingomonas sp. R647]|uniref:P-type conjugative transfer protein TrbG n=1 Tax=Sphingomonas sp. R647 TaxID=2875233 RepID=UPI001CD24C1F|nr:P-type conjugative transfer protein TrbG [Sphingomonas sp. R647]MCA1200147.1 P-type conjugative transfer protein TrbG [Sphingomonas sp. R647]